MSNPNTSRTGTTRWRKTRADMIRKAKQAGLLHCPLCDVPLDYHQPHQSNSAEVDHIKPVSKGGTDHTQNLRVICLLCNRTRQSKPKDQHQSKSTIQLNTAIEW